jgi:hypothetical protein
MEKENYLRGSMTWKVLLNTLQSDFKGDINNSEDVLNYLREIQKSLKCYRIIKEVVEIV